MVFPHSSLSTSQVQNKFHLQLPKLSLQLPKFSLQLL